MRHQRARKRRVPLRHRLPLTLRLDRCRLTLRVALRRPTWTSREERQTCAHAVTRKVVRVQDSDVSNVPWEFRRRSVLAIEALLRILHRALETYGGDLDDFVIYLAVISASVGGAVRDTDLAASPPKGRVPARYYRGVSRRAIAASTGLPRETVRRRIAAFVERGLLIEQGSYVRAPEGLLEREDHREFAGQLIQEFQRTASLLSRLAEEPEARDP
jgi:hypothetical protein